VIISYNESVYLGEHMERMNIMGPSSLNTGKI